MLVCAAGLTPEQILSLMLSDIVFSELILSAPSFDPCLPLFHPVSLWWRLRVVCPNAWTRSIKL